MSPDADLTRALVSLRHWKITGGRGGACFSAMTLDASKHRWAQVLVRRKAGESLDDLIRRGLAELHHQLCRETSEQRTLVRAESPSRFAN